MFQYSVILGNVGQCSDRYMTCGYGRPFELPELFERVASIPGVTGIEYIGSWHLSDKTVHQIADLQKQYGFRAVAIIPDHLDRRSGQRARLRRRTRQFGRLPWRRR